MEPFANLKPASRLRYLRELSACLSVAVGDGYLDMNPVPAFTKAAKLKVPREGEGAVRGRRARAPVDRAREARGGRGDEKVYLYACRFSCETGARLGELIALEWPNVDLLNGRVRIEHQWDDREGLIEPKDREPRTIYLTPQARKVLDEWVEIVGVKDSGPVFPRSEGGRLGRRDCSGASRRRWRPPGSPRSTPSCGCRGPSTPCATRRACSCSAAATTRD